MLTIQLLIKNNEKTIEKCLNSLINLGNIVIIDIGSTDKTPKICKDFGYKPIPQSHHNDYSRLRNKHLKDGWNMYLFPYEFLADGILEIRNIIKISEKQSFLVKVLQGTVISKEIRLWNKSLKFSNPVYEKISDKETTLETEQVLIYSDQHKMDLQERSEIISAWKSSNPTSIEPYYYQALNSLLYGNYKEFTELADHYLFKEKNNQSAVMLRYYLAMVQAHQLDEFKSAIENTLTCIGFRPKMAEFWCLLGDVHYTLKQYGKAKEFYENAMILGSQRLLSDRWPLDVSKYKAHPSEMIDNIKKMNSEIKIYRGLNTAT